MTIEEIRTGFPHIQQGKIYLNHASIGPLSTNVVEQIQSFVEERSYGKVNAFGKFLAHSNSLKTKLAKMFNCNSEEIARSDNVSNGLNILAQSLDWKAGDRIILFNKEFPSNIYPFLNLKSRGVEIDFIEPEDGTISIEKTKQRITPRTGLLSISFVQFLSGFRADLKSIGKLCKENEIIFAVDSIREAVFLISTCGK